MTEQVQKLKKQLKTLANLDHAHSALWWDRETKMPKAGAQHRSEAVAELSGLHHQKLLALDEGGLLSDLKAELENDNLSTEETVIVRETWRTYERATKLPEEFVRELSELTSEAQEVWAEAREQSDFSHFAPKLKQIVSLKQKEAELVGYDKTPYDALLDEFEPGMTAKKTEKVFANLRDFLVPFIDKIEGKKIRINNRIAGKKIAISDQQSFNKKIAKAVGFNFDAGRLDTSTHPFTMGISPQDVRITTRYNEANLLSSFTATMHEMGHGLYELGLPNEHYGTPLAEHVSLGVHESQSRFWENHIGRSQAFWRWLTPQIKDFFTTDLEKVSPEDLYAEVNTVEPSLIRVEADEVTYNLHIIIRFELEKALIEDELSVKDLPAAWNEKYKEYLGIDVPNDAQGVLQDIHWSMGSFGYFPTYTFGTLYAAQFDDAIHETISNLDEQVNSGDFDEIHDWLNDKVYQHGRRYLAEELAERIAGSPLEAESFQTYIKNKYNDLYN